jgi:hypothetical protein
MAATIGTEVKPTIDSILALLEIVIDDKESHYVRLDAADTLLSYEAPEEAVQVAREYLASVFNDKLLTSQIRLVAIKLMRKSEARKVERPPQLAEGFAGRLERARKRVGDRGLVPDKAPQEDIG